MALHLGAVMVVARLIKFAGLRQPASLLYLFYSLHELSTCSHLALTVSHNFSENHTAIKTNQLIGLISGLRKHIIEVDLGIV